MNPTVIQELFNEVKKQGLSMILLALLAYFFYNEVQELKIKIESCQNEYREFLLKSLHSNTKAVERLNDSIERSDDQ